MKFIRLLGFLLLSLASIHAQEVTLCMQVLYDGEKSCPAGNSIVHFSDGQVLHTNNKGELSRKFILKDSVQLVKIDKILTLKGEAKMVNYRPLQYILLGRGTHKTDIDAYILEEAEWGQRENNIQKAVDHLYQEVTAELSNTEHIDKYPKEIFEMMQGFMAYKPRIVSNLTSTIYSELTAEGKNAYALLLENPQHIHEAISALETNVESNPEARQDLLLLARLSVLSFNFIGISYYLNYPPAHWTSLGSMMEFKEVAIVFNQSSYLLEGLNKILSYVKDPEFQATNRNDLASIYQERGDYQLAIEQTTLSLQYYSALEKKFPEKYKLHKTAVLFNLGNAYLKLERYDEAMMTFDSVLDRISPDVAGSDQQLPSIGFFANKFVAQMKQKLVSAKSAYPYYDNMFSVLKNNPDIALTMPKDMLFGDYLNYCEAKEMNGASADEVADCYEESIRLLDKAFDAERKTLGSTVVYHKLGVILQGKGEIEKALNFYHKALSELEIKETYAKREGANDVLPKTREICMELFNCMGELLDNYGRDEEALDYFRRGMKLAQAPGYEKDLKSLRQLALCWYKTGQFHYGRRQADSAYYAFSKCMDVFMNMNSDQEENKALLANTCNMMGAVCSELKNDDTKAEENFKKSVDMYRLLADADHVKHTTNLAKAANNLLALQSKHLETTDKKAALALIDDVMQRFVMIQGSYSDEASMYMENMNGYMQLFSGNANAYQQALISIQALTNKRQVIVGDGGKSQIQSQIVSKLEHALENAPEDDKDRMKTFLSQELGILSWYAIFDWQFALAESSARRSLDIDPSQTWVNTNLAHSLILQGKVEDGKAIYNQFKYVEQNDGQLMRVVFLADIEKIEKAGIKHPAWEGVKKMLR